MKKKIFLMIIFLLLIGFFCFNQKKSCLCTLFAPGSKATAQAENNEPAVTFLELGSVRCIPCKMMQPVMDGIEKEYAGKVKVVFYDVWTPEGEPYAQKYGIQGIPTQIFLDKEGKEFFRHTGFFPKDQIVKILEENGVTK